MHIRDIIQNRPLTDDLANPVKLPAADDTAEPTILSASDQAKAVVKARKQKIINLIAAKQAAERQAALNDVSDHDKEILFINSMHNN